MLPLAEHMLNDDASGLRQLRHEIRQQSRFAAAVRTDDLPLPAILPQPLHEGFRRLPRRKEVTDGPRAGEAGGERVVVGLGHGNVESDYVPCYTLLGTAQRPFPTD